MPFAEDPQANLLILETMVAELEDYLHSDELFRQLVVQAPDKTYMPRMTIGLMLEHVDHLEKILSELGPDERIRLEEAMDRLHEIRDAELEAYATMLRREMKSHLDSWSWYLDGCADGDEDCPDNYPSEVWLRTRLEEVVQEARNREIPVVDELARLQELDRSLDDMFQRGDYVGPKDRSSDYAQDRFWWLYGMPIV